MHKGKHVEITHSRVSMRRDLFVYCGVEVVGLTAFAKFLGYGLPK